MPLLTRSDPPSIRRSDGSDDATPARLMVTVVLWLSPDSTRGILPDVLDGEVSHSGRSRPSDGDRPLAGRDSCSFGRSMTGRTRRPGFGRERVCRPLWTVSSTTMPAPSAPTGLAQRKERQDEPRVLAIGTTAVLTMAGIGPIAFEVGAGAATTAGRPVAGQLRQLLASDGLHGSLRGLLREGGLARRPSSRGRRPRW